MLNDIVYNNDIATKNVCEIETPDSVQQLCKIFIEVSSQNFE